MAWIEPITNHQAGSQFTAADMKRISTNSLCLNSGKRPAKRDPDSYQFSGTTSTDLIDSEWARGVYYIMHSTIRRWNAAHPDDQIPISMLENFSYGYITEDMVNRYEDVLDYLIRKTCTVED